MKRYMIVPLHADWVVPMCEDMEQQYKNGVCDEVLFMMSLRPEGNPVINKAKKLCAMYDLFAAELKKRGVPCGVLVQASIGHGGPLAQRAPMQYVVGLTDCTEQDVVCPYDAAFLDYMRDALTEIARRSPSTVMVDDDFRLFSVRGFRGCTCPRHLKETSARMGREVTREELHALLDAGGTEEEKSLLFAYYNTQIDALLTAARAMREGIDAVDPHLQGAFCFCGDLCEGAAQIAAILAGEGNPVIVRGSNSNYTSWGARGISTYSGALAAQRCALEGKVDLLLAETDTCPHNRYSTSAAHLHTHFTASILEGARGGKHWLSRMNSYEPKSGLAYRKKLARYARFYEALERTVPTLEWQGVRIPYPTEPQLPTLPLRDFLQLSWDNAWQECVLERLGLPMYYGSRAGGAVFLDGARDGCFDDAQIKEMLSGTVFLSSQSAKHLIERGFGEYLGVDVQPFGKEKPLPYGEKIHLTNTFVQTQTYCQRLCLTDSETEVHATLYTSPDGKEQYPLCPSVTRYRNCLGGTVVVFAGRPRATFNYGEGFSFLNEARKAQLAALLLESGNLPLYYPEDAEVYVKAARMADGRLLCAFVNIGMDVLEEIPLVVERPVTAVTRLGEDGQEHACEFTCTEDCHLTVYRTTPTLCPEILFLA